MAGKGGTGKTTIAALLVKILKSKQSGSILAIDADPNSNLAESIGISPKQTIGEILDDISAHPEKVPTSMSKDRFLEYQVQTLVQEGEGVDCLTMGRPEGPGCYCYVNNVLRNVMSRLIQEYKYIIIDNEAGLEHLSRRTTRKADAFVVVSDASVVGLKAAQRIADLIKELNINTQKIYLVINRYDKEIDEEKIKNLKLEYIGFVPQDKGIEKISLNGSSLMALEDSAPSLGSLRKLGEKICN